jgi:hypothetical protein
MPIRTYSTGERFTPTNFNTYSINNGMKFVAYQSISSSSNGIELYNCFTSEFDAYRIVFYNLFTYNLAQTDVVMRLATAGTTPYSGAAYNSAGIATFPSSTQSTKFGLSQTSWNMTRLAANASRFAGGVVDLLVSQFSMTPTYEAMMVETSATNNTRAWSQGGFLQNNATYTGFQLFAPSTTMGGVATVYGYRKP